MKMARTERSRVIEPFVVERSPDKKRGSSSSDGSDAYPEAVCSIFLLFLEIEPCSIAEVWIVRDSSTE